MRLRTLASGWLVLLIVPGIAGAQDSPAKTNNTVPVRIIAFGKHVGPPENGDSSELADALERMMKSMRKNPVQVLPPGKPDKEDPPKLPKKKEKREEKRSEKKPGCIANTPALARAAALAAADEKLEDVLSDVELSFIGANNYYGAWVALLRNNANKKYSTYLIDKPLPLDSPYQREMKEKAENPRLREPSTRCAIKGPESGKTLLELQVIRIEPLHIIVQANGKMFKVRIGQTLKDELAKPLSDAEVKALKLP
jgi:hypothetical protein